MRLAGLLHRAARLCRGCVPWSSRGAAAPQLCGGRVPIIQALKAAGGSGSRRSAVCRFSARSLCAGRPGGPRVGPHRQPRNFLNRCEWAKIARKRSAQCPPAASAPPSAPAWRPRARPARILWLGKSRGWSTRRRSRARRVPSSTRTTAAPRCAAGPRTSYSTRTTAGSAILKVCSLALL